MKKIFALILISISFMSLSSWAQSRCSADLCIGDVVLNINRDYVRTQIVAIEYNGNYVLRFLEGPLAGKTGGNWSRIELAVMQGCNYDLCVGNRVYNLPRQAYAIVAGIQYNGLYALEFTSGPLFGRRGGNWSRADLEIVNGPTDPTPPPPYEPPHPRPPRGDWICSTNANGYHFTEIGRNYNEAYERTLATCTSRVPNSRGNCRGNMVCNQR